MRRLLLSLATLGAISAMPVEAAPALQPALNGLITLNQANVQTVQYDRNRYEYRRRQELRRREELRRERYRRRHYRRGY